MKRTSRLAIWALLAALTACSAAFAQNGPITGITFSSTGRPAGNVNVAVCSTLTTTAAAVANNVATLTFASNPITQGFVIGQALTVFGFTGGDTYLNGAFIISSVSASTVSYNLIHANGSAGSNGTVYQTGNTTQACAPLASLTTDNTGNFAAPNPFQSDGLGNYTAWSTPGFYRVQAYASNFGLSIYATGIACVPGAAAGCTGTFGGSIAVNQVAFGTGTNTIGGSTSLLWTPSGGSGAFALTNTTAATSLANQNSPTITITGNAWNGAVSVVDSWTFQDVTTTGASQLFITHTGTGVSAAGIFLPNVVTIFNSGGSTGILNFTGGASGSAGLTAAQNAGSPNLLALPTNNPVTGQLLQGVSGAPNQAQWATPGVQCGTMATNAACSNTLTTGEHFAAGIAILTGGTSTFTGISPAFTSATSYFCVGNDITTSTNAVTVIPATSSSVTVTGTGVDHVQFICIGG